MGLFLHVTKGLCLPSASKLLRAQGAASNNDITDLCAQVIPAGRSIRNDSTAGNDDFIVLLAVVRPPRTGAPHTSITKGISMHVTMRIGQTTVNGNITAAASIIVLSNNIDRGWLNCGTISTRIRVAATADTRTMVRAAGGNFTAIDGDIAAITNAAATNTRRKCRIAGRIRNARIDHAAIDGDVTTGLKTGTANTCAIIRTDRFQSARIFAVHFGQQITFFQCGTVLQSQITRNLAAFRDNKITLSIPVDHCIINDQCGTFTGTQSRIYGTFCMQLIDAVICQNNMSLSRLTIGIRSQRNRTVGRCRDVNTIKHQFCFDAFRDHNTMLGWCGRIHISDRHLRAAQNCQHIITEAVIHGLCTAAQSEIPHCNCVIFYCICFMYYAARKQHTSRNNARQGLLQLFFHLLSPYFIIFIS